jgi:hypothetical protein
LSGFGRSEQASEKVLVGVETDDSVAQLEVVEEASERSRRCFRQRQALKMNPARRRFVDRAPVRGNHELELVLAGLLGHGPKRKLVPSRLLETLFIRAPAVDDQRGHQIARARFDLAANEQRSVAMRALVAE